MEHVSDSMHLPAAFQNVFCQLLFHFEMAIPIGASRLFFPSLLLARSQFRQFTMHHYTFPRNDDLETLLSKLRDEHHDHQITTDECDLPAPVNVTVYPTGLCYRRFFVLTVAPAVPIWPRLISRCLTDSKFLEIIKNNCCDNLPFQSLQDLGKTKVGNSILEWIYWKNGMELRLGDKTLLQVSSVDLTSCSEESKSISSCIHIKDIYIHNGDGWLKLLLNFTSGIEVAVPECILISLRDSHTLKVSEHISLQIFTHFIEVVDEIFMEWFSCTDTSRYLVSFTPCAICVGDIDKRPNKFDDNTIHDSTVCSVNAVQRDFASNIHSTHLSTDKSKKSILSYDQPEIISVANKYEYNYSSIKAIENPVGFTIVHCLWTARNQDYINCPKHGKLELQYLTPDLVNSIHAVA